MPRKSIDILVIGYGLSIIYGLGLLIYLWAFIYSWLEPQAIMQTPVAAGKFKTISELQQHAIMLWLLYFPQVIGFLGLAKFQEWGRKLVIGMNVVMFMFVLFKLFLGQNPVNFLSTMSILISVVLILYLSQPRIKEQFQGSSPLMNKRILIIDDDKGLLKIVKASLTSHGYEVFTSTTGEQGLKMAKNKKPFLIFLDVILPGMKGREVCSILKEDMETRKIPVIFLTSKDSPDDVRAEIEVGGASHITKPIDSQKLLVEVKKIIGI